jgi:EmrB/QacA subfamily drug resistance transporter
MNDLSRRRRILILLICCMSLLIVGLDSTIVNVALPSLGRELHAPVSGLQWTIDAYTVVIASLLMFSGSMADRLGRRRVFQTGLVVFSLGSLLCSIAPGLWWLVAFRGLQAVGGSMLNPVAMSIIRNTFTDPRERAQAIGVWGGVVGISLALGPLVGGALVVSVGWRSIFWINVPVGLAALLLTARFVPESKAPRPRRVDPIGQLLVFVMLASLTYAIIEGHKSGWLSGEIVALFALSLVALGALVWYEPRHEDPLIELRFFRSAPFSGATVIAIAAFAALGGYLFLNTLYLQEARGLSAFHAGLYTLPMAVMTAIFGPISGRLVGSRGARPSLLVGGAAITISSLILTDLSVQTALGTLFLAYFVFGIGFGFVNAPITNTAVTGMPAAQAGVAAAVASTARQIGMTLGVAIVGAVGASASVLTRSPAVAETSHPGWWFTVGCGVAVFTIGLATTTRRAKATAERTASEFGDEARVPAHA